ncbi:hypothetical protein EJ05DRAFT_539842 [Pseudovirgaria hyperparasitica]|uniref:Uncharacterized protein n=1 Tax=Pseudovirgaria hyperparasitica TaxID=470096 RepID=A0A6A6W4P4_9PEZI|nr:uncharacterized protein EJ05DRAFT_539842 [Pseudovirgaria hyperparasitica]KAF2756021.1 hypothetical protein EJ05DRAFT_539842 [Pseudovirgaria hyperparasitica]
MERSGVSLMTTSIVNTVMEGTVSPIRIQTVYPDGKCEPEFPTGETSIEVWIFTAAVFAISGSSFHWQAMGSREMSLHVGLLQYTCITLPTTKRPPLLVYSREMDLANLGKTNQVPSTSYSKHTTALPHRITRSKPPSSNPTYHPPHQSLKQPSTQSITYPHLLLFRNTKKKPPDRTQPKPKQMDPKDTEPCTPNVKIYDMGKTKDIEYDVRDQLRTLIPDSINTVHILNCLPTAALTLNLLPGTMLPRAIIRDTRDSILRMQRALRAPAQPLAKWLLLVMDFSDAAYAIFNLRPANTASLKLAFELWIIWLWLETFNKCSRKAVLYHLQNGVAPDVIVEHMRAADQVDAHDHWDIRQKLRDGLPGGWVDDLALDVLDDQPAFVRQAQKDLEDARLLAFVAIQARNEEQSRQDMERVRRRREALRRTMTH